MQGVAQTSISPRNNFNLIRLTLAGMVVAYHVVVLSGGQNAAGAHVLSIAAQLGVQGFFVVSGYLVWESLERSASIRVYAEKRARRLVPAYVTVVLLCAICGLAISAEARDDFPGVASYLGWNLVFLNSLSPTLPGVFAHNPFPEVNGALWTLKIEVMFYLALPVLAWIVRKAGAFRWIVFLLIYVAAEAWRIGLSRYGGEHPIVDALARQLPGQMSFFITGIALACWRDRIRWRFIMPVAGLTLTTLSILVPIAEPVRALGLGITVIWLSVGIIRLPDAARFGDISYGLYIVHFPIIQALVALGLFADNWVAGAAGSVAASVLAALLLWRFVEKPALRTDSAYRR